MYEDATVTEQIKGIANLLQAAGKEVPVKARVVGFWGPQITELCDNVTERQGEIGDDQLRREVLTLLARVNRNLDHPPTDQNSETLTHYPGFQWARDHCADDLLNLADRLEADAIAGPQRQPSAPQLDAQNLTITLPDGTSEGLTETQYRVVSRLVEAGGGWLTGNELRECAGSSERIDTIINGRTGRDGNRKGGLPESVRQHIESGGPKGRRWCARQ